MKLIQMVLPLGLIITIGLSACSKPADPSTSAYWIELLANKKQRPEALKQLGQLGDKTALPAVVTWFEKKGPWQAEAAYAIGQLGDETQIPIILAEIDYTLGTGTDSKTKSLNRVNINIAKALAMLKGEASVDPLVRLTDMPDPATRVEAINALGKIRNSKATGCLVEIADTESQPFIRKVAIVALGEIRDPKAVPVLIKSLFQELPGTSFYYEARFALLQIGAPSVPDLLNTFKRKIRDVENIRLLVGSPIAEGAIEGKTGFVLGALRAKSAEAPMVHALNTLYKKYQNEAPVFASIPGAISELAYSLGQLGNTKASSSLIKLAKESNQSLRIAAIEALVAIGDKSQSGSLTTLAGTGNYQSRKPIVEALALLGTNQQKNSLEKMELDSPESTKQWKSLLSTLSPAMDLPNVCKQETTCWENKLEDTNSWVRRRAAHELGWMNSRKSVQALLKAAEDQQQSVRMAALASIDRVGGAPAAELQEILDRWSKKIEYRNSNQELKRLLARLRSN
ncbi:MAG: HEAT repeat domain-containing protein [Myxococcota bacterium]|nr:HEAT repeat domain-containing protein [Myxococcota bacterium]